MTRCLNEATRCEFKEYSFGVLLILGEDDAVRGSPGREVWLNIRETVHQEA